MPAAFTVNVVHRCPDKSGCSQLTRAPAVAPPSSESIGGTDGLRERRFGTANAPDGGQLGVPFSGSGARKARGHLPQLRVGAGKNIVTSQPQHAQHLYGHGRSETVAGLAVGMILAG
jgi:hypothetical protein